MRGRGGGAAAARVKSLLRQAGRLVPAEAKCWLSLLIPAYNVGQYVGACLQSVVEQVSPGIEVTVVDDGSTDSTPAVLAAWQRRYPDLLRVHTHVVNRGIAATRNHLVSLARGQYLWFIDADDTMLPGAISALRTVVDRHAPDIVLCDYRRSGSRGNRRGRTFVGPSRVILRDPSTILAGLFEAGQLHPWSKISNRLLWSPSLRFPEGRVFEDVDVMPKLVSPCDHGLPHARGMGAEMTSPLRLGRESADIHEL